jgi:predicted nucleic acid-binding protein
VKVVFVDTLYFVALFNPRDQWHDGAIAISELVAETKLITTEDVLVELLNFFSEYGDKARRGAVGFKRNRLFLFAEYLDLFSRTEIKPVLCSRKQH